jgi:hypothetical protein
MYILWFQQIVFEGTWGSSRANGFIGFDDITFFSAACSSKFMLTSVQLISVLYDITWIVITAKTSVILQSIQSIKKCTANFRKYMMHLCHSFVFLTNFWKQKCCSCLYGMHDSGVPGGRVKTLPFPPPPPEIPKFYKDEPDCKLSGKCLVFLFQHPN